MKVPSIWVLVMRISVTLPAMASWVAAGNEVFRLDETLEIAARFKDSGRVVIRDTGDIDGDGVDEILGTVAEDRAVIYDPLNPVLYYWRAMAWKAMNSQLNMLSDLKLSCELGYEPACAEYNGNKPQKH